jgi:uncharacterized membrane protein
VAEFFGLIVLVVLLILGLLPVLTFLRLGRISRELEELSARVTQLERASTFAPASAFAPDGASADRSAAQAAPAAPVAPDAPAPVAPVAHVAPVVPVAPGDAPDLEERIGGRGLLYIGVVVLLFGVSFFLKYAFDNAWVNETGRSVLGAIGGLGLVAGGLRLSRGGLHAFGQALTGTGFAILYLVVYAALNFYTLINRPVAFVLMVVNTVAAAMVADRQRSQALAVIAVGGAFLTPALVGGEENAQLTLFTYDALLVLGTLALSWRHRWLALNALSYAGTLLTVLAWVGRFYTSDQWLRTLLFLTLFCVCFLLVLRATRSLANLSARIVRGFLWTAPIFYHVAAVTMTAAHPPAIHVYLIAFTVVGLWLTVEPHRPVLRLLILLGVFVPMFGSLTLPDGRSWLLPNVISIIAIATLHLMALVDRVARQEAHLRGADFLSLHACGLGAFGLLYEVMQPAFPGFRGGLAAIVAIVAALLARWLRTRDKAASLNAIGLAMTLIAVGIAVQFDTEAAIVGWAVEGAAAAWFGLGANRYAFLIGGFMLWVFSAVRLFESYGATPAVFTPVINVRTLATLFVVVSGYVIAWRLTTRPRADVGRLRFGLHVIASALTLRWITAEIQSFWDVRDSTPQAYLYEHVMLSLAWGLYGAAVIAIGLRRNFAPLRYIGIAVITFSSLKVLLYDLWALGGIYQIVGFIAFGVLLVTVSYLYQKRRASNPSQSPPPPPPPSQPPPPSEPQSADPPSPNAIAPSDVT